MLQLMTTFFHNYPETVIFLSLAGGYLIGKIKIFKFSFGSTVGVLLVAMVLGQLNIPINPLIESIAFALFIFTIGYKVGPEFFSSLKKEGVKYFILTFVIVVFALILAVLLAKLFHFDVGTAAGLLGGALTQSTVIGTANGAISQLIGISATQKTALIDNVAIAYAITYVFGTAGLIVFFKLLPKMMRIDLKDLAKKMQFELIGGKEALENPEEFLWNKQLELRAYRVQNKAIFNQTVEAIKAEFKTKVAIDKIKRGSEVFEPTLDTVIYDGDLIAIVALRHEHIDATKIIGVEVDDDEVTEVIGESLDVCVLQKNVIGKTVEKLLATLGAGCFIQKINRQGHEIPVTSKTRIKKCDVIRVIGSKTDVEKFVTEVGYPERLSAMTDLIMVGLGCVFGTMIGILHVNFFGIPLTFGVGGGVLIAGLFCGWLRSLHPTFGEIPTSAQWILTDFGLNLFIACVGITAGPAALHAIHKSGAALFFAGAILTLAPMILGMFFGKYVLKMNPVLLIGALTGAETSTAALNAMKEDAESTLPAIGYTVPYAIANVLLTIWGALIVHLV